MGRLMQAAVEAGSEAMAEGDDMVIAGERNLLSVTDLSSNMSSLRQMFEMFEQKTGLMQLLDLAFGTLGDLRRKLRVNELTLYVLIGGADDPAKAAMGYGRAWAAIGAITPSLERLFVIKKRDIRPALDYTISNTQIDAHLVTTITIGRSLALALRAGIRFLKILNERKKAV